MILCSCGSVDSNKVGKSGIPGYDLYNPDNRYELPNTLLEISGIAAVSDSVIACVADEKGTVYFFNLNSGRIENKLVFAGKGDFEDLTIVHDTMYVMNSNGTLWTIKNYRDTPSITSTTLNIELPFELEGLCDRGDTLFVAAKYYHNKKKNSRGELPVWKLTLPEMQVQDALFSLPDIISPSDKQSVPFHTSAMLFNEREKEWIFISTHTKAVIRCDYTGNIIQSALLPSFKFSQPEGICFTPSGNLLISNEGKDGRADILLFIRKNIEN
jgi:hypothetical protein